MDNKRLKKVLKPLIKQCIKEVIFEEGVLSSLISEVVKGTEMTTIKEKNSPTAAIEKRSSQNLENKKMRKQMKESRKKLLDALGKDAYNGINVFEGTKPLTERQATGASPRSALENVDPKDPGVDISNTPGANIWKDLIK